MKKWFIISVAAAFVVLVGGIWFFNSGEPVQVVLATRGAVREYVDEQGKTRLPTIHRVTMPFAGRIEPIAYVEGDQVTPQDIVARVVQSDLQLALDEAQGAFDRFEAAIAENNDNSVEDRTKDQSVELVDSMVQTARAAFTRLSASEKRLEYATKYREDIEKLVQQRATSTLDLEKAEVDEVAEQAQFAQDYLAWKAAESMKKATDLLPRIVDAYIDRKDKTSAVLAGQRDEAKARLEQMKLQTARGTMHSPVHGTVLSRVIDNEQFVPAGAVLLTIGELDKLEIETDVLSHDAGKIEEGDEVEIYGAAVEREAARPVKGLVRRIYPAGFTKISSLGVEQQRVKIIIAFQAGELEALQQESRLGVDFRVRVRLITDEKQDVLIVPRSAVYRAADGGWEVFAVRGRHARRVAIEVGLVNDQHAEVVKGLTAGEAVVPAPESSLKDGSRVRIVE